MKRMEDTSLALHTQGKNLNTYRYQFQGYRKCSYNGTSVVLVTASAAVF